ncbi:unnamed protein product [Acanthoscelides obtectus]|uniref:CCHC-type domain-containing protein n=1 Tax=Acanthoscelides obtectus TaxID=200917 RepID=A0A9P0KCF7_ACAOB|nr:unnamed protein product [Acanthoscelides obtectus]CAK1664227.1 hypothetical protein AOBTE_LOCUS24141 [Acanthoscelides obtectus]
MTQPDNNRNSTTTSSSYSSALLQQPVSKTPSKNQAILLTAVDGIKIHDYIIAIGSIVGPKNILFASRIANGRICMYLSNTDSVDKIITEHKSIKIQDHDIEIRRLVTPAQRLVISNVCPSVPNNIIESSLTTMGLKLLSRITYLRVGMPENEYNHILSFRRQVYIAPPVSEIVDSTTITFEETTYRIFFSVDGPSCTLCKQTGHTLEKCPKSQSRNEDTESRIEFESSNVHNKTNTLSLNMTATIQDNSVSEETRPKRQISTSPVSTNTQPTLTEAPTKRIKTSKVSEESLEPAEEFINSRFTSTKLNVSEVADMIENTYKSKDIIATFRNYTNNIPDMNQFLAELYPHLKDRSTKIKITKIRKKLAKHLENLSSKNSEEKDLESSDGEVSGSSFSTY